MTEAVVLDRVGKSFASGGRRLVVLSGLDLSFGEGELVTVYGRSGSGKTTLLSLIGGLDQPDAGRVYAVGEELSSLPPAGLERFRRDKAGLVFQTSGLHPLLTAAENVALALRIQGRPEHEALERAGAALADIGLGARAQHRAHELSGGEQQRVALARALVKGPRLLLADEPTGQLDTQTAREVTALIRGAADRGVTVIVATHDEAVAELSDRVVRLQDGRIAAP